MLFHTAEQAGHQYAGKGRLRRGARPRPSGRNFPTTRVIFAHFGGGLWAFEAMPEMRLLLQNARYDTAAWPWLYGPEILDAIFAIGVGDKIFFGSDWPILGLSRYEKLAAQTKLSEAEKEKLFGGNVREISGNLTLSAARPPRPAKAEMPASDKHKEAAQVARPLNFAVSSAGYFFLIRISGRAASSASAPNPAEQPPPPPECWRAGRSTVAVNVPSGLASRLVIPVSSVS